MNKKDSDTMSEELVKKIKNTEHPDIKQQTKNTFRTSFKISDSTFQLMNKIKDYYGLSTKELMDIIIEFYKNNSEVLFYIIQSIEEEKENTIDGTIKTFIIDCNTKKFLEEYSWSISRDVLLNKLILGFNIRFDQLLKGQKDAMKIINEYSASISELYAKLKKVLPENDPIYDRIGLIEFAWEDLVSAIQARLDYNTQIATNDIWQNS